MRRLRFSRLLILAFVAALGTLYYTRFHAITNLVSSSGSTTYGSYGSNQGKGGIGNIGNNKQARFVSSARNARAGTDENTLAFIEAASKGDIAAVKALLPKTKVDGRDGARRTALMYASGNGYHDICSLLLAAGANPLAQDESSYNALDYAAARGLVETVRYLTAYTKESDNRRILEYAAILHAAYADDIAQLPAGKILDTVDRISAQNASPLHIAANSGARGMAEALIRRGASVNITNHDRQTPLHWAAWNNQAEMIALLIKNGANTSPQDAAGNTPLILAAQNHSVEAVRALLAGGARKDSVNKSDQRALIVAQEKGYADIVALLQ